jgi:radical SAM protein with 4Fe4S-binding SPASM domain
MTVLSKEVDKCSLKDLTIEITRRCMNKCIFCSSSSGPDEKEFLEIGQICKVLEQAKSLRLGGVIISGGEPLLHPELESILLYCKKLGLKVTLYTSGVIEDLDNNQIAFRDWHQYSELIHRLVFNITSISSYNRDLLYGRQNSFETMKSVEYSRAANFHNLEANVIPNRTNLFGLKRIVKSLAFAQFHQINFLRLVAQGRAFKNRHYLELSASEMHILHEVLDEIASMQVSIKRRFGIPFSYTNLSSGICTAGESKLVILPSGQIIPCEAFKDIMTSDLHFGHIDHISLEEVLVDVKNDIDLKQRKQNKKTHQDCCIAQ